MPLPAESYPHYYRAEQDYLPFGLWKGDLVRYDPTRSPSIAVIRYLPPNHGRLLDAVEAGVLTPLPASSSVVPIRRPAARPAPRPPAPPLPGRVLAFRGERHG